MTIAEPPQLGPGAVHLWSCSTDPTVAAASWLGILDETESARAERLMFQRDRDHFMLRRGFTRRTLARYLDVDPVAVGILPSAFGRPELHPRSDISFSTSQSEGMTVVAVARAGRVGVDVERLRPIGDELEIADAYFAPCEIEFLHTMPSELRSPAFLAMWTQKESVAKALGGGMSIPFDRFQVMADGRVRVMRLDGRSGSLPLVVAGFANRSHVGAVALAGNQVTLRHMGTAVGVKDARPFTEGARSSSRW